MSLAKEITANAKAFLETAKNLVAVLEKNIDSFYRIKRKVKIEKEVDHIERLLSLFPQLMFFNGVFITSFSPQYVMKPEKVDQLSKEREGPELEELEKSLDEFSELFDKHAPHIHGLGMRLVVVFKQGIEFRRALVAHYHSGDKTSLTEEEIQSLKKTLEEVYPIEKKLFELKARLKAKKEA
jgi:hypothetical protein